MSLILHLLISQPGRERSFLLRLQLALICASTIMDICICFSGQATAFSALSDIIWTCTHIAMLLPGAELALRGPGAGRFRLLQAACWLPLVMVLQFVFGRSDMAFLVGSLYSTVTWTLLGWSLRSSDRHARLLQ